ncbi:uncharacterized protein LOC107849725 [Capsicum annuum]|uniref:uncharacterized protein LOC107849725 n=1 Tax=Capsicum annuum TaxID=4072 RepID=UPI001FB12442|nr:uncharacterized protein LOC107849725 [Capsicum annuum]
MNKKFTFTIFELSWYQSQVHPKSLFTDVGPLYYIAHTSVNEVWARKKNYLEWAQSVRLAIDGRRKLRHLIGETKKPEVGDLKMNTWRSENLLLIVWLINSMEPFVVSELSRDTKWGVHKFPSRRKMQIFIRSLSTKTSWIQQANIKDLALKYWFRGMSSRSAVDSSISSQSWK